MAETDPVQVDINEILNDFAQENARAITRAITAEAKARAQARTIIELNKSLRESRELVESKNDVIETKDEVIEVLNGRLRELEAGEDAPYETRTAPDGEDLEVAP